MATARQLLAEPYWGREITTPELDWLADHLCAALGRPRSAAGTKGNFTHLYGGHRSQEWILQSAWCTDRYYTVQRGLSATQARHIGALDITPDEWGTKANRTKVTEITRRLVAAGKAGTLPGVWEVIGTLDGRTPVGVDLPEGQVWPASEDHLEHDHITFDRRRLADRAVMERVLAVALGEDDDMELKDRVPWVTADQWERVRQLPGLADDAKGLSVAQLLTYGYEYQRGADTKAAEALREAQRTGKALDAQGAALAAQATAIEATADGLAQLVALIKSGTGNPGLAPVVARLDKLDAAVATLREEQAALRGRLAAAYGEP